MSQTENKALIANMWEAFSAGDKKAFFATMADDIKFTVMGSTSLSLVTHGKEEMAAKILKPLAAALDGDMTVTVDSIIADGEWVVMRSRGFGAGKNGQQYNNQYAQFFRVRDGLIAEWIEYLDTGMLERVLGE